MSNTNIYINYIAGRYGGLLKEELKSRLHKLVQRAKEEQIEESIYDIKVKELKIFHKQASNQKVKLNNKFVKKTTNLRKGIEQIIKSNYADYNKVLMIIELCKNNNPEYLPINIIPENLFSTFWAFYENGKYGIELDEIRNCQYFIVKENDLSERNKNL